MSATTGLEEDNRESSVPSTAAPTMPMWQQEKKGGICCGGCCDFRRAVIVVNVLGLLFSFLAVVYALAGNDNSDNELELDEDSLESKILAASSPGISATVSYGTYILQVACLVGAIKYIWVCTAGSAIFMTALIILQFINNRNTYKAVIGIVDEFYDENPDGSFELELDDDLVDTAEWYRDDWIQTFRSTFNYLLGFDLAAFLIWIYPVIMLTKELKQGTMTKETYVREAHSCCCSTERDEMRSREEGENAGVVNI